MTLQQVLADIEREFEQSFPQTLVRKSINWGLEDDPKPDLIYFLKQSHRRVLEAVAAGVQRRIGATSRTRMFLKSYDNGHDAALKSVVEIINQTLKEV